MLGQSLHTESALHPISAPPVPRKIMKVRYMKDKPETWRDVEFNFGKKT